MNPIKQQPELTKEQKDRLKEMILFYYPQISNIEIYKTVFIYRVPGLDYEEYGQQEFISRNLAPIILKYNCFRLTGFYSACFIHEHINPVDYLYEQYLKIITNATVKPD